MQFLRLANVIDTVVAGIAFDMKACATATFKEGRAVSVAGAALLSSGYSLVESYPSTSSGTRIWLESGVLKSADCELPMRASAHGEKQDKPDLRVHDPAVHFEFKVLPRFGAKSLVAVRPLNDDIEKLLRGAADVFVLCADDKMYDQARGAKRDPRGRPRLNSALLDGILPPVETNPFDVSIRLICTDKRFCCVSHRVSTSFGLERIAAAILLSPETNPALEDW